MLRPVIAIVGRPNVGKSTLFNRLVGRRQSIVRDVPGVTRDRLYGTVTYERWQGTVVDTGGFEPGSTDDLVAAMRAQIMQAIEEADLVVFTVDTREGLTPVDEEIAHILRRSGRPIVVAAITSNWRRRGPIPASRSVPRSPLAIQANPAKTTPASMPQAPPAKPAPSGRTVGREPSITQQAIAPATAPAASHHSCKRSPGPGDGKAPSRGMPGIIPS